MAKQNIISVSLSDEMIEWLDSLRETDYGTLTRSSVIRNLITRAMQNKAQREGD